MLAGCQGDSIIGAVFPVTPDSESHTETGEPETELGTPQETPSPAEISIRDLVIWVPPQFDPSANNPAAQLFNQRLQDYQQDNPHINVIVRVKSASGPGSLLETLISANAVAPDSLPALALLTRSDMNQAISKNLLAPMDELSTVIDEDDWFTFSRDMAIQQGTSYGLPFASNLLGIVYRQQVLESDQPMWDEAIRRMNQLIFPAGDPDALVTMSLYLSAEGEIRDAQGHQMITPEELTDVLNVYAEASRRGLFPSVLTELQNDDQAWEFFQDNESDAVITWASRLFIDTETYRLAMLPSIGDQPYTTATGWLWCLPSTNEVDILAGIRLAEYLVASDFLEEWSPVSGVFPVRPSSQNGWDDSVLKSTISGMLQYAYLRPDRTLTSVITPELKNSVGEVLTRVSTPAESAQKLIDRLEVIEAQ